MSFICNGYCASNGYPIVCTRSAVANGNVQGHFKPNPTHLIILPGNTSVFLVNR